MRMPFRSLKRTSPAVMIHRHFVQSTRDSLLFSCSGLLFWQVFPFFRAFSMGSRFYPPPFTGIYRAGRARTELLLHGSRDCRPDDIAAIHGWLSKFRHAPV